MTPPVDVLTDTGEQDAIGGGPSTSKDLKVEAQANASEAYVNRRLAIHIDHCGVKKFMRKFQLLLAAFVGFSAAFQIFQYLTTETYVRKIVVEVVSSMKKDGTISFVPQPLQLPSIIQSAQAQTKTP